MKKLTMIAAIGKNNELGLNNDLIWKFHDDMMFFRKQTMYKQLIMGRKTLDSLPHLLEGRRHFVLTRQKFENGLIESFPSIEDFLDYAKNEDEEIMVIGGESLYKSLLDYSDKLLLTEIDAEHEADAYFPEFNKDDFTRTVLDEKEENNIKYRHVLYKRK